MDSQCMIRVEWSESFNNSSEHNHKIRLYKALTKTLIGRAKRERA